MACSGRQPPEVEEELGEVVADFEPGGGGSEGVGGFFKAVTQAVFYPQDGAGPEYFSTHDRVTDHWEAAEDMGGSELVIPLIEGGNGGSRLRGDWYICPKEAEYGRTVYCDATDSGPL